MTATIPPDATNVNLGSSNYNGATDLVIKAGSFISGYGANYGNTAIYSNTNGITLTSDPAIYGGTNSVARTSIDGQNGSPQDSLNSLGGTGGIGVNLQADDVFNNSAGIKGGNGGSYISGTGPAPRDSYAGAGGVGVVLSNGATLINNYGPGNVTNGGGYTYFDGGSINGGDGGGVFYPDLFHELYGARQFYGTGQSAVGVEVAGGSVVNSGSITGGGVLNNGVLNNQVAGAAGVQLDTGSTGNYLSNQVTGIITGGMGDGGGAGVNFVGSYGTSGLYGAIFNQGTITGGSSDSGHGGDGIDVANGQGGFTDLVNAGTITGGEGGAGGGIGVNLGGNDLAYNTGIVQGGNATPGSKANGGAGISINDGSSFVSTGGTLQGGAGDGSGSGGAGAYIGGGAYTFTQLSVFDTAVSGGTAAGPGGSLGDAVQFSPSGFATLSIDSTDNFTGYVAASYGAFDELILNGSGTLSGGLGTQFTGFSELNFGSGAAWTVDATEASLNNGISISSFASGDTLDVTDLKYGPTETVVFTPNLSYPGDGQLLITNGSDTYPNIVDINFDGLSSSDPTFIVTSDNNGGTDITLACYLRGTRIRTIRGDVPIETLSISDQVLCSSGNSRPVRWLGHRSIDCSRYPDPVSVWPICIRVGALGEQQPTRDLWVSPGHAVVVDGVLVQAEKLINGVTVVRMPRERVEYWHVELDAHDTLLAEGLASESYLDTGNRTAFVNGGAFLEAFPDFRAKHWSETCVPLVLEGAALRQARERVLRRAKELGYAITSDTDVHVVANGDRIDPVSLNEKCIAFLIPAGRSSIELRSRTFVPSHVNAGSRDERALGLCVGRLQIDGNDWALDDQAKYAEGWHKLERYPTAGSHRWTSGRTPLPAGTRLVVIDITGRSYCWQEPEQAVALCG